MLDFLINLVLGIIIFGGTGYIASKSKIVSAMLFVALNVSFGCRLVFLSHGFFTFIFNVIYICFVMLFIYLLIEWIKELNIYASNERVIKLKRSALVVLNIEFILLTLFNFNYFSEYYVELFIAIVILWFVGLNYVSIYEGQLTAMGKYIAENKISTIQQIAENQDLSINKKIPQNTDQYYAILEGLEIKAEKDNSIMLLKDRINIGNTVCIDKNEYIKLENYLEHIMGSKDFMDANEILISVVDNLGLNIDKKMLETFINIDCTAVHCFDNVVISTKLISEISVDIKDIVDKDNYDLAPIQRKYNIKTYTLSQIADYCGFSVKWI